MILNLCSLVNGYNKVRSVPLGFTKLMLSSRLDLVHSGLGISPLEKVAELSVVLGQQLCIFPLVHQETCLEMCSFTRQCLASCAYLDKENTQAL